MTPFDREPDDRGMWLGKAILIASTIGLCLSVGFCSYAAWGAECPIPGKVYRTPMGNEYRVMFVPHEAVQIAASGQPHNYVAAAVAMPGFIWADESLPCESIPFAHEIRHLDGESHGPDGVFKQEMK
jgi:hypothetical protein